MSFSTLNIFSATAQQLQWVAARQQIINRNISLANVPGAIALDLVPLNAAVIGKGAFKMKPTTQDTTLKKGLLSGSFKTFLLKDDQQLSGNTINTEHQLKLSNENALYNKQLVTIRQKFSEIFSMIV